MIKLCIYENNRNSFKIGDRVRSKLPRRVTPDTMAFSGTIIDIDKNGLCTIECPDGTVIDNINSNIIVYDMKSINSKSKKVTESVSSSAIDAFLDVDIEDYDNFYRTLDTVWEEFVKEYAPLKRNWASASDDDKKGELYNKYRPVVDKCKETLKALSITGYGGLKDVYKGYIEELCKKFDYNFPFGWEQHGDWILKYGKNESNNLSENHYCESLTMKSLEKLLFKFIKTNPNIEMYDSYSNEAINIYSYGKTDYITLANEFAEYIKQNNPSEAENIELMADAMYDNTYAVICPCGKRKSVYFNFSDNTNDNDDSDIYVEYIYVLD